MEHVEKILEILMDSHEIQKGIIYTGIFNV